MDKETEIKKIYEAIESLVQKEKELRKEFNIGDAYKVIPSRLDALLQRAKSMLDLPKEEAIQEYAPPFLSENERYVFVHLFNVNGRILSRWEASLSPRLLFEYSVNRPIYSERKQVEAYIRSRPDKHCHAFIMMKVQLSDVLENNFFDQRKDVLGCSLLKLKEGSLKEQGLMYFFYEDKAYLFKDGHLFFVEAEKVASV